MMLNWGEDSLTQFFDMADANRRVNRERYAYWYAKISRIDACLVRAGKNANNIRPVVLAFLMNRCQYALKTATSHALAGQSAEAFTLLRSALEYAGYALMLFDDPALEETFINRDMSAADLATMKQRFLIREVKTAIRRHDAELADIFDKEYERSIDFGGHPNPRAMFSMMSMEKRDGETAITTWAMTGDDKVIQHVLKSTGEVGLTVLFVLQHALKEKFELLGIRAEMDALRNEGGL